jgi:ferredoxin
MGSTVCFSCRRPLEPGDDLRLMRKACGQCFSTILSSSSEKLSAYLESLDGPAALLSEEQVILVSNSFFQKMTSNREVVGRKVGEVLECMYTPLLGSCGETVACGLCKLKISVEHTSLTGEELRKVTLSVPHKAEARRTFTITTGIVGGAVLLVMAP